MSLFKKYVRYVHLWIGLFSGICILIVSLTGAILVFQTEIENAFAHGPDYGKISRQPLPFLQPSTLIKKINEVYPKKQIKYVEYNGPERCAKGVTFTEAERWGEVLVNPYNGAVIKVPPQTGWSFFEFITEGHTHLWIPGEWCNNLDLGTWLVRFTTLFFTFMLITGIVLWYPKNKAAWKQRSWFRWKKTTRWRRKNYDLHNIVGFYSSWIVIFMCFTGLVWSFEWFGNGAYRLLNGGEGMPEEQPVYSDITFRNTSRHRIAAEDSLFIIAYKQAPINRRITIQIPEDSLSGIELIHDFKEDYLREVRTYDQYTLQPIKTANHSELNWQQANAGDKMLRLNGAIHFGSLFGILSKVPVFLACLLAASLPVTGFYVWRGRQKKRFLKKQYERNE